MKTPANRTSRKLNKIIIPAFGLLSGALMVGCSDDLSLDKGEYNDGSIRFAISEGNPKTRGEIGSPSQWIGSLDCTQGKDSLWLHVSSAENLQVSAGHDLTRSLPYGAASELSSFYVTATTGKDENEKKLMFNVEATATGSYWRTDETYYWPEEEVTFYAIAPNDKGLDASNIVIGNGISGFDYEVPVGNGEKVDRDAECQPDLILATATGTKPADGVAHLQFRHPLTGIYFTADETILNVGLKSISIRGVYGKGTLKFEGMLQHSPSSWDVTGQEASAEYTQTIDEASLSTFIVNKTEVQALCEPFMLMPQTLPSGSTLHIELANNDTRDIPLSSIFANGSAAAEWEAGRIYHVHLSKLNALYPPVRNLQGMAGNNTISLTWFYPDPNEIFPHVHQVGVYIEVDQFATDGAQDGKQGQTVSKTIYWPGAVSNGNYPDNSDLLDLFAEVQQGVDSVGNPLGIDTRTYDRFKVRVYASYLNESDSYVEGKDHEIHLSVAATLTIDRVRSNEAIAFYMPEGSGWNPEKNPVECLLDDDDKAAADWFKRNFAKGVFVNKDNFATVQAETGFNVIWFPCGVKLNGEPQKDRVDNHWDNYWTSKASYILTTMDLKDTSVEFMKSFLIDAMLLPNYPDYKGTMEEGDNWHKKTYDEIFKEYEKAGGICRWRNLYNNGGIKALPNDVKYVSDEDCRIIKEFFRGGGNLLLTTFAIEKVRDFGVCERTPGTSMFNEVKQPAVWFVNPLGNGDHKIYEGLFKVVPETFREVYLSDFVSGTPDGDYKLGHVGEPYANEAYFLAGKIGIPMIPLLSNHARACENNNVVWDCGNPDKNEDVRKENAKVLGTWGQLDNDAIGCIVEFEPGGDRKGRCICIGLGAYEFNNGTVYDPELEVMNSYQSNVHLLTKNALEYLLNPEK